LVLKRVGPDLRAGSGPPLADNWSEKGGSDSRSDVAP